MDLIIYAISNYVGNLPLALLLSCLAKLWSKNISWTRLVGYGCYFNILPTFNSTLQYYTSLQH